MLKIKALFSKVLQWITLFNVELTMSNSNWSSGTCTITNISKYSVVMMVVGSDHMLLVRNNNGFRGCIVTGGTTQYITDVYFTTNGDTCTWGYASQVTHTQNGNHGTASSRAISKCVGLIPLGGGS